VRVEFEFIERVGIMIGVGRNEIERRGDLWVKPRRYAQKSEALCEVGKFSLGFGVLKEVLKDTCFGVSMQAI
jgi:hypothetical protein